MSSVRCRLDFGSTQCSFIYIPDLVPLDSPPQVPCVKPQETLPPGKRRKFTAKQVELLSAAFEIDEHPDRQRYEALALSLGVEVKRIQTWFKNSRSKRRRMIRLQKIAHTQEIQRWRRRMLLRRSLNGTPAIKTNPVQTNNLDSLTEMDSFHLVPQDLVLPEQIFGQDNQVSQPVHRDVPRRNLDAYRPPQPCLQTPNYTQVTQVPHTSWGCYAPVQDFPPNVFEPKEAVAPRQSSTAFSRHAFFDSAFKRLLTPSDIFNDMVKENRMI